MGSLLSGRTAGEGLRKVENARTLDIASLSRSGVLQDGRRGVSRWCSNGKEIASIGLRGGSTRIRLDYSYRASGLDWEPVSQEVEIAWRSCRFGGQRPYFRCPGSQGHSCGRHVLKLYGEGRLFLCRQCYGLTYASRSEDRADRARRKAQRSRRRLVPNDHDTSHLPIRPKGMWHTTYGRHLERIFEADRLADERLAAAASRLFERDKRTT
jgi:hypothetical protein